MIPRDLTLAGLRFADGYVELFGKSERRFVAFAVCYTAADDHHRLFRGANHLDSSIGLAFTRYASVHVPNTFFEEMLGIIKSFGFNVLRHCNTNCSGVGRVGKNTHCIDTSGHELLRTVDSVKIFANRLKGIICSNADRSRLFNLLQNRVGLTAGKGVAR